MPCSWSALAAAIPDAPAPMTQTFIGGDASES
jgi:hypothetical protein